MPEFNAFESRIAKKVEHVYFKKNMKVLNLEFKETKKGLSILMTRVPLMIRPMSSPIEFLSGDYARKEIDDFLYSRVNKFFK